MGELEGSSLWACGGGGGGGGIISLALVPQKVIMQQVYYHINISILTYEYKCIIIWIK